MKKLALVLAILSLVVLAVGCGKSPESCYLDSLHDQMKFLADSLDSVTEDMRVSEASLASLKGNMEVQLAAWHQTYQEALATDPPPRYQALHDSWLAVLELGESWTTDKISCLEKEEPLGSDCWTQTEVKMLQLTTELDKMSDIVDQLR